MNVDYSLAPLWARIIFFIALGIIGSVVVFLTLKKSKRWVRVSVSVALVSVFLIFSGSTLYSILNPKVKTVIARFLREERSGQINAFSVDYVFEKAGEKIYIEFDVFTRKHTQNIPQEIEEGKTYTVTFEERENIILKLEEAN